MLKKWITGFPFGVMKTFWNYIELVVVQRCEYTKCHWIEWLMLCEFHLTFLKKG